MAEGCASVAEGGCLRPPAEGVLLVAGGRAVTGYVAVAGRRGLLLLLLLRRRRRLMQLLLLPRAANVLVVREIR